MNKFFNPKSSAAPIKLAHVELNGIEVDMEIGVAPTEQGRVQRLRFDVEVGFDFQRTHLKDSLDGLQKGFDYSPVRDCVMSSTHDKTALLETLAHRVATKVLSLPGALTVEVKVTKLRCWANVAETSLSIYREI